jgi:hypothetical protein
MTKAKGFERDRYVHMLYAGRIRNISVEGGYFCWLGGIEP